MKKNNWIIFALILGGIGLTLLISVFAWILFDNNIFSWCPTWIDLEKANQFGGFIGGLIGIFFSGAGAILIFATFQEQKKLAEKQQFENMFFQMISTLHDLLNTTSGNVKMFSRTNSNGQTVTAIKGREFFYMFLKSFKSIKYSKDFRILWGKNSFGNMTEKIDNHTTPTRKFLEESYKFAYRNNQAELGHFFRLVYNIIKFAVEERGKYKDEKRYIDLIQAQLSSDILALIFYNALTSYSHTSKGEPKFHNWLDKYDTFENIDDSSLLSYFDYRFYPNTNFKYV